MRSLVVPVLVATAMLASTALYVSWITYQRHHVMTSPAMDADVILRGIEADIEAAEWREG